MHRDLERLVSMADHVSVYELTIEVSMTRIIDVDSELNQEGTPLARSVARGETAMPGADRIADEWEEVVETLEGAGVARYEVSNFARGPSAQSRHNLAGWRGEAFAGVGPGAHARLRRGDMWYELLETARPHEWATKARAGESTLAVCREMSIEERSKEIVLVGLRTTEGLTRERRDANSAVIDDAAVTQLEAAGLVDTAGGGLRATAKGLNLLDSLLVRLLK